MIVKSNQRTSKILSHDLFKKHLFLSLLSLLLMLILMQITLHFLFFSMLLFPFSYLSFTYFCIFFLLFLFSYFRKLARLYHPDKNFAPSAEEAFKAIGSAFETLSDPKKRYLCGSVYASVCVCACARMQMQVSMQLYERIRVTVWICDTCVSERLTERSSGRMSQHAGIDS